MSTIRTNLPTINAHRGLKNTGIKQRRASNRLASGFRINSAADDAAGLAISEKIRGQIRGLDQGGRNINDGISLIQTAEGALNTINHMVIRMRELVIQASNDTNTLEDRGQIQREIDAIIDEIDATAQRTQFNTRVLLSGNYSKEMFDGLNMASLNAAGFDIGVAPFSGDSEGDMLAEMIRTAYFNLTTAQRNNLVGITAAATGRNVRDWANSILPAGFRWGAGPSFNDLGFAGLFGSDFTNNVAGLNNFFENHFFTEGHMSRRFHLTSIADAQQVEQEIRQAFLDLPTYHPARSLGGMDFVDWFRQIVHDTGNFDSQFPLSLQNASPIAVHAWMTGGVGLPPSASNMTSFFTSCNISGMSWERLQGTPSQPPNGGGTPTPPTPPRGQGLWIQKGANFGQGMFITIEAMTAERLGLRTANPTNLIDVREEHGIDIQEQLLIIDNALAHVTGERASLGAKQNRLEYAAQNVQVASENLNQANSRIRDADMAREMMRLTMANVLQQAGIAMLAQTQTTTERVLQLLR